ncbi:SurA N-terminal domain-containing protein [Brachybacterium squillarum]|uniref:SurA N-terminal domain-containing protein n=1 Tax=Brachybacterium squillarum TaxID=661979 RepID=UPI002223155C|nr:SurA N-terminal domain-containing protein [Brachybacterium squillarum]MCW1804440.1 SurA N-terminal domain-containing protein [Brachybacterium squillarum]
MKSRTTPKLPRTVALRRTLAAVSLAAAVAITGCTQQSDSSGAADAGGASDAGGQQQSQQQASDGGGAQAAAPDLSDVPDPVAEVNGEKISEEDFSTSYEQQYQQAAMQQQSTGQAVDEDQLKQQVAQQLVDNLLLQQGAKDAGIEASDEDIDATLEQIGAQNGMTSADEVVKALEQQGMDEEQIRSEAAKQFTITTFIDKKAGIGDPTDEELKAAYDQMVQQQEQAAGQTGQTGGEQAQTPAFEDVKDQLAQQVKAQKEGEAAQSIADELEKSGDVTINL